MVLHRGPALCYCFFLLFAVDMLPFCLVSCLVD